MLVLALYPLAIAALGGAPQLVPPSQDTTHHDTAAGAVVAHKRKHTVAYNVEHSTKKAMKDTKKAASKAGTDTGHELHRAAKNTRNEIHRDAERVSHGTQPSAEETARDSARRARRDSAATP